MRSVDFVPRSMMPLWGLIVWALALWGVLFPGGGRAAAPPLAVQGVLDLRAWQPEDGGIVPLAGQWRVRWMTLADAPDGGETFATLPGLWMGQRLPGGDVMGAQGAATYRLRLLLPPDCPPLTLQIPQAKSAVRVLLDGVEVAAAGQPALDAAGETPRFKTLFITLPAQRHTVDLTLEMSNHFHFEGGMQAAPELAAAELLPRAWNRMLLINCGVAFSLIVLAAYIATFSWRRDAAGQRTLSLLLVLVSLRLACTGELLESAFPGLPLGLLIRLEYLPIYLFLPVYHRALADLFPEQMDRRVGWVMDAVGLAGAAFVLSTPPAVFTRLRDPASVLVGVSIVYVVWCIAAAARARAFGARLLGAGAIVFLATVAHDSLMYAHVFQGQDLVPFGVTAFMFSHGLVLGRRVMRALTDVRRLSDQLALLNEGLERQVQDRTRALREQATLVERVLRDAKERAEADAVRKSRFLAHLSHEIRTPMNAVLGMTRLLARDAATPTQSARLDLITTAAHRLVRLLDEVLGLAQVESGKTPVVPEPVDLGRLTREVCALMAPRAQEKGLTLTVATVPTGWYSTDPLRVQQILFNLVGNAIKFTRQGGVVVALTPTVGKDGSPALMLKVADSGPGIPENARARLFDAFTRLEAGQQGFGLGLAIVRGLTDALGGRVDVGARSGGGAVFTVVFPCAPCAPPPLPAPSPPPVAPPQAAGLSILVVEDGRENVLVLKGFLEGHRLTVAPTGEEALCLLRRQAFDLILMDVRLAGMDGLEATRRIRAGEAGDIDAASGGDQGALIPIIGVTANQSPEDIEACLAAGMDEVLAKPIDPERLADALHRHAPARPTTQAAPRPSGADEAPPDGALQTLYAQVCRERAAALTQAAQRRDWAAAAAIAHSVRGSATVYGHPDLVPLATAVERAVERAVEAATKGGLTADGGGGSDPLPLVLALRARLGDIVLEGA